LSTKAFALSKTGKTWRQGYTRSNNCDGQDAAQYQNLCDLFNTCLFYSLSGYKARANYCHAAWPSFPTL